jgi:hypothetical protein
MALKKFVEIVALNLLARDLRKKVFAAKIAKNNMGNSMRLFNRL